MNASLNEAPSETDDNWVKVCWLDDILPDTGVAALIQGRQIAIFRICAAANNGDELYAIDNYDPQSGANVLSRGLTGDIGGEIVVASPIYKHHYKLSTGACLEDAAVSIATYPVRVVQGCVEVQPPQSG